MTRRIAPAQLQELSPTATQKLRAWWTPTIGDWFLDPEGNERLYSWFDGRIRACSDGEFNPAFDLDEPALLPLLSIGQMIELLDEHNAGLFDGVYLQNEEVLGALWDSIKEVLERA